MSSMESVHESLVKQYGSLPDAEDSGFERLVYLAGWVEDRPLATRPEYLAEVHRIRTKGVAWPAPEMQMSPEDFARWVEQLDDLDPPDLPDMPEVEA